MRAGTVLRYKKAQKLIDNGSSHKDAINKMKMGTASFYKAKALVNKETAKKPLFIDVPAANAPVGHDAKIEALKTFIGALWP